MGVLLEWAARGRACGPVWRLEGESGWKKEKESVCEIEIERKMVGEGSRQQKKRQTNSQTEAETEREPKRDTGRQGGRERMGEDAHMKNKEIIQPTQLYFTSSYWNKNRCQALFWALGTNQSLVIPCHQELMIIWQREKWAKWQNADHVSF